ncbi:transcription elongation factor S-II [Ephemerocybe angulata]|uniref:Transcription elongation factor S-II n=1 Tax=Ephemerocybe angulata TaxID=980116 RepID=A0A8H6MBZ5_9AGAR|nr:transcription elongation factor S-II [Tulosesus angulatus]
MASNRKELLNATKKFCDAFSQKKDPQFILSMFTTRIPISAIEYGDPQQAPFLGRTFEGHEGVQEYFRIISELLSYENMSFSEYVVDVEEGKVSVKGRAKFTWLATGKAWDETFAYVLDFDEAKISRYQIWSDTGSAYLASLT